MIVFSKLTERGEVAELMRYASREIVAIKMQNL